jgi:hypothetical protein
MDAHYFNSHQTVHSEQKGRWEMKGMRKVWTAALGMVMLGWMVSCSGTGDMMGKDHMMTQEESMAKESMMAEKELMTEGGMVAKGEMMAEEGMRGMDKSMDKSMASHEQDAMAMKKEMPAMLMGSGGHHAAGKVEFSMGMHDTHKLTLRDIMVDKVPDGYVYLARDGNWRHGVEVGMLKQFAGTVSFDLPAGVDPEAYNSVVIWCKKFNVEIGRAHYGKKMM